MEAVGGLVCRVENSTSYTGVTAVYDTDTAELTVSHLLPAGLFYGHGAAVAAGDRLYLLESSSQIRCGTQTCRTKYHGGLHCLKTADPNDDDDGKSDRGNDERWRWQPFPECSRFCWSSNTFPPELPFDADSITAHAVHPRGRTILVSASSDWKAPRGTFDYGTVSGRWTRRGEWMLPFRGTAHYDGELDAWVGIYLDPHDKDAHATDQDGYCLCASHVRSARAGQPPDCKKVSIENLSAFVSEDQGGWHDGVELQLLYMGERGEYCLVEHLASEKHVLRLTVFRLSYGEDGQLVVTAHRPARSYEMPTYYDAQAFWM